MGAIQVAELLKQAREEKQQRSREACWNTTYRGKSTLCHVRPAVSIDPKANKISFLIRADLSRHECTRIGEHLVWLAEQMHEFDCPVRLNERKVVGRTWYVDSMAERRCDARGKKLTPRMAFMTPFEEGRDGKSYVRATCWADLTPRQAREMGTYLLSLAAQL